MPLKGGKGKPGGRGGPRVAPGRKANPAKDSPELLVGRNPVLESLRTAGHSIPETARLAGCSESQVKRVWALHNQAQA